MAFKESFSLSEIIKFGLLAVPALWGANKAYNELLNKMDDASISASSAATSAEEALKEVKELPVIKSQVMRNTSDIGKLGSTRGLMVSGGDVADTLRKLQEQNEKLLAILEGKNR